jgi:hypothetical protein
MLDRWVDVSVDLSLLVNMVKVFFESEGFEARIDESKGGYVVSAVKRDEGHPRVVFVKIQGKRDDFSVEFSTSNQGRSLALMGSLVSLFGFGVIVQRETRGLELYENIERKFWFYVDEAIAKCKFSKENQ